MRIVTGTSTRSARAGRASEELLTEYRPDVVLMQETKVRARAVPARGTRGPRVPRRRSLGRAVVRRRDRRPRRPALTGSHERVVRQPAAVGGALDRGHRRRHPVRERLRRQRSRDRSPRCTSSSSSSSRRWPRAPPTCAPGPCRRSRRRQNVCPTMSTSGTAATAGGTHVSPAERKRTRRRTHPGRPRRRARAAVGRRDAAVHVVGLPRGRVPQEPRPADRPPPRQPRPGPRQSPTCASCARHCARARSRATHVPLELDLTR